MKKTLVRLIKSSGLSQTTSRSNGSRTRLAHKYLKGSGVEIGALHRPLRIPKSARVQYLDNTTQEESIRKFPDLNPADLVHVDFIANGFTLHGIPSSIFDFLIANHVLQLSPNPVGVLEQWHRVVKTSGIIFFALPKASMSARKGRQVTTWQHMLDDYLLSERQDHDAIRSRNNEHYLEWLGISEPTVMKRPVLSAELREQKVRELMGCDLAEMHYHTFTTESVRELLDGIKEAVLPDLNVLEIFDGRMEIIVIVQKGEQS
jgi:SAM-dependent methyltransferase